MYFGVRFAAVGGLRTASSQQRHSLYGPLVCRSRGRVARREENTGSEKLN